MEATKIVLRDGRMSFLTSLSTAVGKLLSALAFVLLTVGCKEDWSSRIGVKPLYKCLAHPYRSGSLEEFRVQLETEPPRFSFAVLGGTCLGVEGSSSGEASASYEVIISTIRTLTPRPRFVFHVGDIARRAEDAREIWDLCIRRSFPFTVATEQKELEDPDRTYFFAIPGDRDVLDKEGEEAFLRQFSFSQGRIYYSFDMCGVHFVALNSETVDQGILMKWFGWNRHRNRVRGDQLRWLREDLDANKDEAIVVFIHKPLFPPIFSRHEGYCLDQYYFDRERLLRLFLKYPVKVVFSGHEPMFYHADIEGILHVVTAGAGRDMPLPRALGGFHHFLYVAVYGEDRMVVYAVDAETETVESAVSVGMGIRSGDLESK